MTQAEKDRAAERAIARTVEEWIGRSAIESVSVHAAVDHLGESALFVGVGLKSGKDRPPSSEAIDLQVALRDALEQIDDNRFPYVTFSAPDDSVAEPETRNTA